MIIGQVLMGGTKTYFGPWIPSGGNAATFVCDVMQVSNTGSQLLDIVVQTKNSEDSDKDAFSFTVENISANVGEKTFARGAALGGAQQGFKEYIRYQYPVKGSTSDWVNLRMLNPAWLSNA